MKNLAALLLFSIVSCTTVLKTAYGIKDPKIESKGGVRHYLNKNRIDTTRVVFFKSIEGFAIASQMKYVNIPDAMFFNSKGEYVDYNKTTSDCNAGVDSFLSDLREFENRSPDSLRTRKQLESLLDTRSDTKNASITVYITFARYVGKLNKDKAFEWVGLIEKAQKNGVNIQYYLISCDFLDTWNISPQMKDRLGIKS